MSLRKRIQILLAFLVGIPLLLLLYESYQTSRKTLVAQMKQEALQIARLETAQMDLTFEPPRLIVEGLVRTLETAPALSPDTIRELLRRTLHESPDIFGVCVALDPARTPLRLFAPYAFRPRGVETENAPPYADYTQQEWFRIPLQNGRGKWISPYYDEEGKALMITYAAPLRRDGRLVGVVGVDLDLESLVKRLHFLKPGGNGAVYLVNQAGKILMHPALKAIAETPGNQGLGDLAALIKRRGTDTMKMKDPVTRRTSWIVENPIRSLSAEQGGGDWSLIVSWPLDERLAPLNAMGRRMLVLYLFLGGAALWVLNRTFDDSITRPLRRLAEQARSYAAGDFRRPAVARTESRELLELGTALDSLGAALEEKSVAVPKLPEKTP